jgi:flavoprotein
MSNSGASVFMHRHQGLLVAQRGLNIADRRCRNCHCPSDQFLYHTNHMRLDRARSCGWTREICGDSIQRNARGGQSAVHVAFDGIIDDVLTVFG